MHNSVRGGSIVYTLPTAAGGTIYRLYGSQPTGCTGHGRGSQYGRCGFHNTHVVGGGVSVYIMNAVRRIVSPYTGRGVSGVSCIDPTPYRGKLRYFNVLKWEENAKNPPTLSGKRAFFAESGGKYHVFPPLSRILW